MSDDTLLVLQSQLAGTKDFVGNRQFDDNDDGLQEAQTAADAGAKSGSTHRVVRQHYNGATWDTIEIVYEAKGQPISSRMPGMERMKRLPKK